MHQSQIPPPPTSDSSTSAKLGGTNSTAGGLLTLDDIDSIVTATAASGAGNGETINKLESQKEINKVLANLMSNSQFVSHAGEALNNSAGGGKGGLSGSGGK